MFKSHGQMPDFAWFSLFRFTLVIKFKNFDLENHRNTLISFDQKNMQDLNMSCQTVFDLVEALLFELNFGNKLRNADIKLYSNSSIKEFVVRSKLVPVFLSYLYFLALL